MPICPLCQSKKTAFFHELKKFKFYNCKNCKTLFISPQPTEKYLNEYYAKEFNYSAGIPNEKVIRKRSQIIIRQIQKLHPSGKTLLDIGSGYGFFVEETLKQGFQADGIEPSRDLYIYSKKKLKDSVLHTSLEKFTKQKQTKYDFITMIHVIEHVSDPRWFIKQALTLLKPHGILFIETPNYNSHLFYAEKTNYTFLLAPDHLWVFSFKSFQSILKNLHVRIIKLSTYSYPEHFMGVVKSLFKKPSSNHSFTSSKSFISSSTSLEKRLKIFLFDKTLASLLYKILNLYHKGSVLELYIRKKD